MLSFRFSRRRAFTLLEVVLALAISAIVLAIIATGIRLQLRMMDREQLGLEQAELARAILQQLSRDLESVARPPDGDSGGGGEEAIDSGAALQSATADPADADSTGDGAEDDAPDSDQQFEVGLYGSTNGIRFETTRAVPLQSLWMGMMPQQVQSPVLDTRSEFRTVAYYLDTPLNSGPVVNVNGISASTINSAFPINSTNNVNQIGNPMALMRMTLDYAAHSAIVQSAGAALAQQYSVRLADEVTLLQFRYFDGTQWLDQWNSPTQGMPVAVEITLVLAPPMREDDSNNQLTQQQLADYTYSTMVRLPVGVPTLEDEEVQDAQ